MSEFVSRGNGLFFENKLSPQEKREAEYRRRVRFLEQRVEALESLVNELTAKIDKEANNG